MPRKPHEKLPESIEDVEGVTKAAILLLAIGPAHAATVLKAMPAETVEEVTRELASLGRVPPKLQNAVIDEFYNVSIASQYVHEGNLDYAKSVLQNSLDPKQAEREAIKDINQDYKTKFGFNDPETGYVYKAPKGLSR